MAPIERAHFRAMILYDFKSNLTGEQSNQWLQAAFGNDAPSRSTVFQWFAEFRRVRTALEDEDRSGRPATSVTPTNIAAVEIMIHEDPRVTYEEIQSALKICSPAVSVILHDYLRVRKICCR